jgi:hypothetical protein
VHWQYFATFEVNYEAEKGTKKTRALNKGKEKGRDDDHGDGYGGEIDFRFVGGCYETEN